MFIPNINFMEVLLSFIVELFDEFNNYGKHYTKSEPMTVTLEVADFRQAFNFSCSIEIPLYNPSDSCSYIDALDVIF